MITQYNVKESENLFAPTHHRHMLTTKDYILYYTTDSFHAFCETFEFPAVFASLSRFMTTKPLLLGCAALAAVAARRAGGGQ